MSQHGCPERLSNRTKGFQEESPSQPTMEVLVETLTGTAFEMTVSPSDTILAIKSKIFRVEGIPVSQQHILYNLKELDDASSLGEHAISDGARLRLVLGMRVGPISTRRLPPPANAEPWRDIERLLDGNRDESEWCSSSGCRVTVVVLRDGGRINLLRVRQNRDGTYSPLDTTNKYSSSLTLVEQELDEDVSESVHDNEVTMGKMMDLRRRMENLTLQRRRKAGDKPEIQKTRSEETLSVPSLLDEATVEPFKNRTFTPYEEDTFAPLYDGNYTRYDYDCSFADRYTLLPPLEWSVPPALPPIGTRGDALRPDHDDRRNRRLPRRDRDDDAAILEECLDGEPCRLREGSPQLAAKNLAPIPTAEYDHDDRRNRRLPKRDRDDDAAILEECLDGEPCRLREGSHQLAAKNLAPIPTAEYGPLVCGSGSGGWRGAWVPGRAGRAPRLAAPMSHSASSLQSLHALQSLHSLQSLAAPLRPPHAPKHPPLQDAVFSSSTSDLEKLKRNSRILPALSRHRNREHLHLSDDALDRRPRRLEVGCERRQRHAAHGDFCSVNNSQSDLNNQHGHNLCDLSDQYIHNDFKTVSDTLKNQVDFSDLKSSYKSVNSDLNTIELRRNEDDPIERRDAESDRLEDRLFKFDDYDVKDDLPKVDKKEEATQKEAAVPPRAPRPRCSLCRKRLSIATEHRCRCGAAFCAPHRYAEVHGCHYDYRRRAAELLAKDNPKVQAPKLPKI